MFGIESVMAVCGVLLLVALKKVYDKKQAALAPVPVPAITPAPNPMQQIAATLAGLRPAFIEFPGIRYLRGGWRTAAEAVTKWTLANPNAAPLRVANFALDGADLLVKLSVLFGAGGAGKTTLKKLLLARAAWLLFGPKPVARRARMVIVDPTGLYRPVVDSLPAHVSVYCMSLDDKHNFVWKLAEDVDNEARAYNFIASVTEVGRWQSTERFWNSVVGQYLRHLIMSFVLLGSRAWLLSDVVSALAFSRFARAAMNLNPQARDFLAGDAKGDTKLGQEIEASVRATTDPLSAAAALEQQGTRGLSMREFVGMTDAVIYISFRHDQIKPFATYYNAMLTCMMTYLFERQVQPGEDYTYFVFDEAAYMKDLEFIADIPKKGRGSGVGACVSFISIGAAVVAFGRDKAYELCNLARLKIGLSCDPETAKFLSESFGTVECYVTTESIGVTVNTGYSYGHGAGPGGGSWNEGWTKGDAHSTTTNEVLMTRPVVLESEFLTLPTPANALRPGWVSGYAHTSDAGAFYFEFDIGSEYRQLPPMPDLPHPKRKGDLPLAPWAPADLARLHIDVEWPGFTEALEFYRPPTT